MKLARIRGYLPLFYSASCILFVCNEAYGQIHWENKSAPDRFASPPTLAVNKTSIFSAAAESGVYRSLDQGDSWTLLNKGIDSSIVITSLIVSDSIIVASFIGLRSKDGTCGLLRSTNNGDSWERVKNLPPPDTSFIAGCSCDGTILANGPGGLMISTDSGESWKSSNSIGYMGSRSLCSSGSQLYGVIDSDQIIRSDDCGQNWKLMPAIPDSCWALSLTAEGDTVFVSTGLSTYYTHYPPYTGHVIFRSTDAGESWTYVFQIPCEAVSCYIDDLAIKGAMVFAGTEGDGVCLSSDGGTTWGLANTGLESNTVYKFVIMGEWIFAGAEGGIFRASLFQSGDSHSAMNQTIQTFSIVPNILSSRGIAHIGLLRGHLTSLTLFDLLGRVVKRPLVGEFQDAGAHEVPLDVSGLTPGIYSARLVAGDQEQVAKFVVSR